MAVPFADVAGVTEQTPYCRLGCLHAMVSWRRAIDCRAEQRDRLQEPLFLLLS
ncbi:MAG: hypothetical protein OJF58_003491 [Enhydrobacter sp.]|nr:MAG: hypothetical protein OJF58_003491 [Enhydrobacter sp.]